MSSKINPLNSKGERFWKSHFKCLYFLKYFVTDYIDFLEEKMKSPELSILIASLFSVGITTHSLGLYTTESLCIPYFPDYIPGIPSLFLLDSSFSIYSHYFYPILLIGNLKSTPLPVTILCAVYSAYDFTLHLIDVI
jgi:hypothetical protein